jgi:hypothetical protein
VSDTNFINSVQGQSCSDQSHRYCFFYLRFEPLLGRQLFPIRTRRCSKGESLQNMVLS